jgi:drug/metabolite transporter (DMT)-like permease
MQASAFVVAVAYTKAEPVLVLLAAWLLAGEAPGPLGLAAILVATAGVMLMSWPGQAVALGAWLRPLLYGLGSGGLFAISAVGFRSAILAMPGEAGFVLDASVTLVTGLVIQTASLSAWLWWRRPQVLLALLRRPLEALPAGFCGALASQFWFLAFAIQSAPLVRTLGLSEVLFSQLVTRRLFGQRVSGRERAGLSLLLLGLAALLLAG